MPVPEHAFKVSRRRFLQYGAAAAALLASETLPLFHLRVRADTHQAGRAARKIGSWEDLYRERWTWDRIAKGSHGWANCRSACEWDLYVKNGVVVREEQTATYDQSEAGVPDFNPRGCQKGACYTEVMYGPSRLTVPLKRVGERGCGPVGKDLAGIRRSTRSPRSASTSPSATAPTRSSQDLGPQLRPGRDHRRRASSSSMMSGGAVADDWAEIGDLNLGATLTLGFAHIGGSSRRVVPVGLPRGLDDEPVGHADSRRALPLRGALQRRRARRDRPAATAPPPCTPTSGCRSAPGTDAALALCTARHIWRQPAVGRGLRAASRPTCRSWCGSTPARFLREADAGRAAARDDRLYFWDRATRARVLAPGSEGASGNATRRPRRARPGADRGQWFDVRSHDGSEVGVATVGSLLREHAGAVERRAHGGGHRPAPRADPSTSPRVSRARSARWCCRAGVRNRYVHSDLMNRAKILCLALKGAIGKKGAGYPLHRMVHRSDGFGAQLQAEHDGACAAWSAMLCGVAASPASCSTSAIDLVRSASQPQPDVASMAREVRDRRVSSARTNAVRRRIYNHQGIAEDARARERRTTLYPRSLDAYNDEAREKGWMPAAAQRRSRSGSPAAATCCAAPTCRSRCSQALSGRAWSSSVDVNPKFTLHRPCTPTTCCRPRATTRSPASSTRWPTCRTCTTAMRRCRRSASRRTSGRSTSCWRSASSSIARERELPAVRRLRPAARSI